MTKPGPDREVTRDGVLQSIHDIYGPAVGTSEIAEKLGVTRQAVDNRLRELESDGYLNTRKIGRSRVWWLSDKGEQRVARNLSDSGSDTTK